jgi:predicted RNA-binding protein with PUA-like domain
MGHWLVKTEPDVFSIDDFAQHRVTSWTGVRNYQARNFLQSMQVGDDVLIYHSNAEPPCLVGLATVAAPATPDLTQFDPRDEYFDPKATQAAPRWFCPDLRFVRKFKRAVSLDELRTLPALEGLRLLQRGSRLSVVPVEMHHFKLLLKLAEHT